MIRRWSYLNSHFVSNKNTNFKLNFKLNIFKKTNFFKKISFFETKFKRLRFVKLKYKYALYSYLNIFKYWSIDYRLNKNNFKFFFFLNNLNYLLASNFNFFFKTNHNLNNFIFVTKKNNFFFKNNNINFYLNTNLENNPSRFFFFNSKNFYNLKVQTKIEMPVAFYFNLFFKIILEFYKFFFILFVK